MIIHPLTGTEWYVYLLQRADTIEDTIGRQGDRSTYVGITNKLEQRVAEHNAGKSRSTRGCKWILKAGLIAKSRNEAATIEQWLKCGDSRLKRMDFSYACGQDVTLYRERGTNIVNRALIWYESRKVRKAHGYSGPARAENNHGAIPERTGDEEIPVERVSDEVLPTTARTMDE